MRAKDLHVVESGRAQHGANRGGTHAVQRRVDDLQVARPGRALPHDRRDEGRIDLFLAILDPARRQSLLPRDPRDPFDAVDPIDHALVVRREQLAAG